MNFLRPSLFEYTTPDAEIIKKLQFTAKKTLRSPGSSRHHPEE
jgi:hypothetical protein